jgi:hypothetical protein
MSLDMSQEKEKTGLTKDEEDDFWGSKSVSMTTLSISKNDYDNYDFDSRFKKEEVSYQTKKLCLPNFWFDSRDNKYYFIFNHDVKSINNVKIPKMININPKSNFSLYFDNINFKISPLKEDSSMGLIIEMQYLYSITIPDEKIEKYGKSIECFLFSLPTEEEIRKIYPEKYGLKGESFKTIKRKIKSKHEYQIDALLENQKEIEVDEE